MKHIYKYLYFSVLCGYLARFSRNRLMLRKKKMRVVVIFLRKMLVVFFFCYNFVSFLKHKNCFIIKI